MRSLFFKIFLWFWLIVVLVGVTLEISTFMIRRDEEQWRFQVGSLLPVEAKQAAEVFERSGKPALERYLDGLERRASIRVYFFDENGNAIVERDTPPFLREMALNAGEDHPTLSGRNAVAAQQAAGPSGRKYTLVLRFLHAPIRALWTLFQASSLLRLLVILLFGGILCLWLTRHITRPVIRLRAAAAQIANGRLNTRVGSALGRRGDEIALLGRDFDRMAERIETLITAQRNLLGDVSHELRSPLSRLMVALSLLRRCRPEEAPEYLDRIKLEGERLDKLIGQLLTLARIESGVDAGLRETFDLTNLVQEVAADGDFEGRPLNRTIKVLSADPCTMSGMAESLRSAIENVVRNAIRHTPSSTAVEITLRKLESKALLRVRDHGSGVPEEILAEIFQPFRSASAPSGQEMQGAGLGLAIAERVVRMHEGKVWAANAAGGGLVVEIELPIFTNA